ncbi:solute carrier family 25 member 33-like [Heptranchias perlo]|uniref:solute carrier family 25 member 33-like n=1 Tax=Heptranchias perlo TaxID=212740 RepID=UPI0035593F18
MTASYAGISETVIHFVLYEDLKRRLRRPGAGGGAGRSTEGGIDFFGLMGAGAISKTCASCIAYPHEVIRTRLREEGRRYRAFVQTVRLVAAEEGCAAFYRGLLAQLARQIPNTAVMMATYEFIVFIIKQP